MRNQAAPHCSTSHCEKPVTPGARHTSEICAEQADRYTQTFIFHSVTRQLAPRDWLRDPRDKRNPPSKQRPTKTTSNGSRERSQAPGFNLVDFSSTPHFSLVTQLPPAVCDCELTWTNSLADLTSHAQSL